MSPKLGHTSNDQSLIGRKDAFHVPAVLASAIHALGPGDPVKFTDESLCQIRLCNASERHAVVDPFTSQTIYPGTLVWCLLHPQRVSNLRHNFDIAEEPEQGRRYERDPDEEEDWCDTSCET